MKIEELTCKQYIKVKMDEYKKSNYYNKTLQLKKNNPILATQLIKNKEKSFKDQWKEYIQEYGRNNKLDNKIIYSYIKEFSYNQLLYDFRRGRVALDGWIPTEKYTINF